MDAFRIIALVEGDAAAESFRKYIDGLSIKPETREKISVFDLMHPLYTHGFHPALALHMIEYNKKMTAENKKA